MFQDPRVIPSLVSNAYILICFGRNVKRFFKDFSFPKRFPTPKPFSERISTLLTIFFPYVLICLKWPKRVNVVLSGGLECEEGVGNSPVNSTVLL